MSSPKLKSRIQHFSRPEPIFDHYGIETEIDQLLRRKVWLKSGGHLTIDETEALVTIDVNTGKFIGSTSLNETILRTNLDAANEISRQLRLRDIGGIIVIDFIDMTSARDRAQVVNALEKALKRDRTRTKISHISQLGIVEMTRKRTGETISETVGEACPYCQGRGRVASAMSISIEAERALKKVASESDSKAFVVHVNPRVALHLIGPRGEGDRGDSRGASTARCSCEHARISTRRSSRSRGRPARYRKRRASIPQGRRGGVRGDQEPLHHSAAFHGVARRVSA